MKIFLFPRMPISRTLVKSEDPLADIDDEGKRPADYPAGVARDAGEAG